MNLLTCPVCRELLTAEEKTFRCTNGHCFDLAKEGYLNLLLSHQRKSKNPGDDKAMIQARRRFFDSGAFDPLTDTILNSSFINPHSSFSLLDCGCGEGHFLGTLCESCDGQFIGMDISKDAIRAAAKRYKQATWVVANGMRDIPLADQSIDIILSVLAPRNPVEFSRVLKPGGQLILGVPGPNHLIVVRSRLSGNADDFEEKADEAAAKCTPLFEESDRQTVTYQQELSAEQLADLVQMTPIFWTSAPEAKDQLLDGSGLTVTVSFVLITLANL